MNPRKNPLSGILAAALFTFLTTSSLWSQDNSRARIVRLSFVEGDVTVLRPDVDAWAKAPVNTPLEEGFKISTGENSFAEIQFENGGTLRLGQRSLLNLEKLELAPNGSKINEVELNQGYATFHPFPSRLGETLQVQTPLGTLQAREGAEFRVDLAQGTERVEVFEGSVDEESNLGGMTLEKDSVLILQPGAAQPTVVSQGITEDDWDEWVDNRENRIEQMSQAAPSPDAYSDAGDGDIYGWADLQQYGSWTDVPGMGEGWSPNMVAGNWSPYTNGQWCWYPGWGYTWIGSEPWGWLPYHYGGWDYIPARGWTWFPGRFGSWAPAEVTWYHGTNWVGWRPRPHRNNGASVCGDHCGGGVVSEATLRQGGLLNSTMLLGVNPASGAKIHAPEVTPATAAKLPGPAVAPPAGVRGGLHGNLGKNPAGAGAPGSGAFAPGSRRVGSAPSNSTITYDPQQGTYVNNPRVVTPGGPYAEPRRTGTPANNPHESPGSYPPVPVGTRKPGERTGTEEGFRQPASPNSPAPTGPEVVTPREGGPPRSNSNVNAPPPSQGNTQHGQGSTRPVTNAPEGRWTPSQPGGSPSGGRWSPTPPSGGQGGGGGGHANSPPSGGGSSGHAGGGGGGGHAGSGGGGGGGRH